MRKGRIPAWLTLMLRGRGAAISRDSGALGFRECRCDAPISDRGERAHRGLFGAVAF